MFKGSCLIFIFTMSSLLANKICKIYLLLCFHAAGLQIPFYVSCHNSCHPLYSFQPYHIFLCLFTSFWGRPTTEIPEACAWVSTVTLSHHNKSALMLFVSCHSFATLHHPLLLSTDGTARTVELTYNIYLNMHAYNIISNFIYVTK